MQLTAENWKEAVALAHDYTADVVAVSRASLGSRESSVEALRFATEGDVHLIVLDESGRKVPRAHEEDRTITYVPYRVGGEGEVIDAMRALTNACCAEVCQ